MKRISIIFLLFCISLSSYAEKKKDYHVSVSVKNQPIRVLFSQIESQLDLKFSYNTKLINADSAISYKDAKPVKRVINDLFGKKVKVKIVGNYIVLTQGNKDLKASEKANPDVITFTGKVVNSTTKQPLENVSVYDIATRQTVLTNSFGEFKMTLENGDAKNFNVAKLNFSDTIVAINIRETNAIKLELNPQISAISVKTKPAKKALINDSAFVEKMVPKDGQLATENLMTIDDVVLWQVSAVPTIGTNMKASGIVTNRFSFNVLGGYNGGVEGIEIGGLFNILTKNMVGFQVAGLTNQTMGTTKGLQVAGIFNRNEQNVTGIQVGGIANYLHHDVLGLQVGGISNIVNGKVEGIQISGIHNHTVGSIKGLQASGIINWSKNTIIGMQVAGIANNTSGNVLGLQLAGIQNVSYGNVNGAQIAAIHNRAQSKLNGAQISLVNYAKVNNGLQLGLVNISDTTNGVAIGLFNYVKNGYHPMEVFANEVLYANVAFKSGVDAFYTTWMAGFRPSEPEYFGFGFGIGTRINTWKWLSVSIDLSATLINETELTSEYSYELNLLNRADVTLDFNIWKFTLFAGPAINFHISQLGYESTGAFTTNIAQDPFFTEVDGNTQYQSWLGGKAGLRYNF